MTTTSEIITPSDTRSGTPGSSTKDDDGLPGPQPLGSLLTPAAGPLSETPPVVTAQVVTCDGQDVVLIGPSTGTAVSTGSVRVEVVSDAGVLTSREASDTATLVTDPARRESVLRRALSRLAARYRDTSETARRDADAARRDTQAQAGLRSRLRGYAITLFEADHLGRGQLDDFLSEFDLPAYRPAFRVGYTIKGSYLVIDSTFEAVRADAGGYLRPDLSELDDVEDDSSDYTVYIEDVEEISDGS